LLVLPLPLSDCKQTASSQRLRQPWPVAGAAILLTDYQPVRFFFHNQQIDFALRHKELKTQVKNKARRTQAIKRRARPLIWALE
jgi:hypothetical protein